MLFSFPHTTLAALSVDGSNYVDDGSSASGNVAAPQIMLTTTLPNDIIVLMTQDQGEGGWADATNTASVSSVSDTAGLTWQKRSATTAEFVGGYEPDDTEVWWAYAPSPLSSDTITATMSGGEVSTDCQGLIAFGVNGANTSNPWDTNGSLPVDGFTDYGTPTTASVSPVSTSAANTMLLGFLSTPNGLFNGDPAYAAGTGYTRIAYSDLEACSSSNAQAIEYQVVSSAQSGATTAFSASTPANGWVMIGDAIQAAGSGGGGATGRIIRLTGGLRLIGGIIFQ